MLPRHALRGRGPPRRGRTSSRSQHRWERWRRGHPPARRRCPQCRRRDRNGSGTCTRPRSVRARCRARCCARSRACRRRSRRQHILRAAASRHVLEAGNQCLEGPDLGDQHGAVDLHGGEQFHSGAHVVRCVVSKTACRFRRSWLSLGSAIRQLPPLRQPVCQWAQRQIEQTPLQRTRRHLITLETSPLQRATKLRRSTLSMGKKSSVPRVHVFTGARAGHLAGQVCSAVLDDVVDRATRPGALASWPGRRALAARHDLRRPQSCRTQALRPGVQRG